MVQVLPFQEVKPEEETKVSIRAEKMTDSYGIFVIEPLPRGWGTTIGNPLRRVLLSSLPGAAVTWVKIESVLHEFTAMKNMREDVIQFLLNVKGIRIKSQSNRPGKLRIEVSGGGVVTAGDVQASADFEVVNPDHYLAYCESETEKLNIELNIEQGVGYRPSPSVKNPDRDIGTIPVDAVFTPIRKANFKVEPTRVGSDTTYERLILEVWTDLTISPEDALKKAGELLAKQIHLVARFGEVQEDETLMHGSSPEAMNTLIEDLQLSARTQNSLRRHGLARIGEVLQMKKSEIMKINNLGKKSYTELFSVLKEKGFLPEETESDGNGTETST